MIEPLLSDDVLLADIQAVSRAGDSLHLWWLGQSGFLVRFNGRYALLDPYLSDSLTEKYAATDKPHVRMTRRVIEPEKLDFVDVVTSSHNHTDHLDAATLKPILRAGRAQFMIPEANRQFVSERLAIDPAIPIGIDAGTTASAGGFEFIGVAAAHETIDRDEQGRCKYLGYIVRAGPWTIYHSGDTILYDGMAETLKGFAVGIALLPINGSAPERHVAGNLNGREAAWLAKQIGAGVVIPCHYDMFAFNTAPPDEFVDECGSLDQPCRVMRQGERITFNEPHKTR